MELELDRVSPRMRARQADAGDSLGPDPRPSAAGMKRVRPEPSNRLIPLHRTLFVLWVALTLLWAALLAAYLALSAAENGLDTVTNIVLWLCLVTLPSMILYAGGRWFLRWVSTPERWRPEPVKRR